MPDTIHLITADKNWIEGEALRQLEQTAALPGMQQAVGLPDLHPGKGHPVGAVFASDTMLYPYLIGNDIGCGMALFMTDLRVAKVKLAKLEKRLHGLEQPLPLEEAQAALSAHELPADLAPRALGTLGGGNHFAELQRVVKVEQKELFAASALSKSNLFLLIHSGSRGVGEAVLRHHVDSFKNAGVEVGSDAAGEYLARHDEALRWAELNRQVLAQRLFSMIGGDGTCLFDIPHNLLRREQIGDSQRWLHRKGAAAVPDKDGSPRLMIIPGSRGSQSFLVRFLDDGAGCLNSIAHGAGRKWNRSECRSRLRKQFSKESLQHTELGSRVICEDTDLLYEEAPQAYKKVQFVVEAMVNEGLIEVVAVLEPILTYKKRQSR